MKNNWLTVKTLIIERLNGIKMVKTNEEDMSLQLKNDNH